METWRVSSARWRPNSSVTSSAFTCSSALLRATWIQSLTETVQRFILASCLPFTNNFPFENEFEPIAAADGTWSVAIKPAMVSRRAVLSPASAILLSVIGGGAERLFSAGIWRGIWGNFWSRHSNDGGKVFHISLIDNSPDPSCFQISLRKHPTDFCWINSAVLCRYIQFIWTKDKVRVEMRGDFDHILSGQDGTQWRYASISGQSERPYFLEMVFWMKVQYLKTKVLRCCGKS